MVANHWSNDAMVTIHCSGLVQTFENGVQYIWVPFMGLEGSLEHIFSLYHLVGTWCITWWAGESGSGGNASHLTHPVLTRLRGAKADPKTANNADHIILSKCTQVLKTHIGRLHIYELCKNEAVLVAL